MYGNSPLEQIGMNLQRSAKTIGQAEKRLASSCAAICGCRSTGMECKNCGVYRVHVRVVSDLMDKEEEMERKFMKAARIAKATGCTVVVV